MEPRAHHVLIGLFTVIAVIAALLFALWLSKKPPKEQHYYQVVFNVSVRGLSNGSEVQYNGIKVGEVTALELDPRDPRKVFARVRVDARTPIKQDTRAQLALLGVTGNSVIEFSGGSPDSPPLVSADGRDPVILGSPSPLVKFIEEGGSHATEITDVIQSAKAALSPANVKKFSEILANLERASGAVASQDDNIKILIKQLAMASRHVNPVMQEAHGLLADAHVLVNNEAARALGSAERAMTSLEKSADTIDQLLLENRTALSGAIHGFNEVGPTLREFRETLVSIRRITARLEENPAGYLTGREKIEEVKP